jgi:hypothetical protein
MTDGGARQEFLWWGIELIDRLKHRCHHALDADAIHAAEINRALAQKTR